MQVRRWHEGIGTDQKPAWARGCERRVCESEATTNGVRETVVPSGGGERARGQRLKDMNMYSHEYAVYAYDTR